MDLKRIKRFFYNLSFDRRKKKEQQIAEENLEELSNIKPTKKINLVSLIEKRKNLNPDKVNTFKVDEEIKHYQEIILKQKNKGTPEKLLTNLRQKVVELQTEKHKIEIVYELLNQDNYIKTAFGKRRQREIYKTVTDKYENNEIDLHQIKKIIRDISDLLKDKKDRRTESVKLEDFYNSFY